MTLTKRALTLALAALAAGTLALAQAAPPAGSEAERKAEALRHVQEAERHAQEAKKHAEEAAREAQEKAKQIQYKIQIMESRPRLGVLVNTDADPKTDPVGAQLTGVTPGGAAEEAGVKAGDIVVKFNGQALAGPNPKAGQGESAPGLKLLQLAKDLKVDEKVSLEVRRGKETKTFAFAPRSLGARNWVFKDFEGPDVHVTIPNIEIPDVPELLMLHGGAGFDMELVALNPELGEYFGAAEGLLVVRAPKDDALKLRGGDVLLKIGERAPKTPSQAVRILRSYESGEEVSFEVLRKQKRQKFTVKMPERDRELRWVDEHGEVPLPDTKSFRFFQEDELPPAPPAPPSPPAPPAGRA